MTTQPTPASPFPPASAATHKQALGAYGETLAARHLVAAGMVLLDRNWRGPSGEIDLVLRDRDVLVICEVKTRSSDDYGTPHEAVGQTKVDRLRRLAAEWLRTHEAHPRDVRIDLVAVLRPRRGPSTVEHVRGLG
jgi:putative endonuclease